MREVATPSAVLTSLAFVLALSSGCAVPQPQNTPREHAHLIDPASNRGFYIYVPSTYRHDRAMPVIVTCHGTPPFDVAEHHIREWRWLGEQNGCIVVAPELTATDGLLGDGPVAGMYDCERVILSLISLLQYRYNIDRANIMITGFSGGGFPTYWVGFRNPDVFSCIVARSCNFNEPNLHGWYPPEAKNQALMVYYGSNDPGTISAQSKNAIRYLRSHGFDPETAVIPGVGHERHPEVAMEFFRRSWKLPRPTLTGGR